MLRTIVSGESEAGRGGACKVIFGACWRSRLCKEEAILESLATVTNLFTRGPVYFFWRPMKYVSAEESVAIIKSGDRVFIHTAAAAPQQLIKAMTDRAPDLLSVEVIHLHTEGEAP